MSFAVDELIEKVKKLNQVDKGELALEIMEFPEFDFCPNKMLNDAEDKISKNEQEIEDLEAEKDKIEKGHQKEIAFPKDEIERLEKFIKELQS